MSMNILVTGSTGFIGTRLVRGLEAQGNTVYQYGFSLGNDIRDKDSFNIFLGKGIDAVFHLAGLTFVPDSWANPEAFYCVNTLGTQHTLEFCRNEKAKLIYASAYVYGIPQYLPIDEKHPAVPNNPYAHSKWLGEELCRFYSDVMGVQTTVLRPFNLYGPGQDDNFLIPMIIKQAREGKEIVVKDDKPRRDYIHVDDFIDACILALQFHEPFKIFNVGSGYSSSVGEIVEAALKAVGNEIAWRSTGEIRHNEIPDTIADCRCISELLGWRPTRKLEASIYELINAKPI